MVANRRRDTRVSRLALEHAPGIGLGHCAIGQNAGAPVDGAEKRAFFVIGKAGALDIVVQVSFEIMVTRRAVLLAAFPMQTDLQRRRCQ
jgi:hypothetical protein